MFVQTPAIAQITLPDIRDTGTLRRVDGQVAKVASSATHAEYSVRRFEAERSARYTILDSLPYDAVKRDVAVFSDKAVQRFTLSTGLQHQPYGVIAVDANRDAIAAQHFQAWLVTPALPIADKASAYKAQFDANLDPDSPERIKVAEDNLRQLRAVDARYNVLAFSMEQQLVEAYYAMGQRDSVISHAEQMFERLFKETHGWGHRRMYLNMIPLTELVQAYSGMNDGAKKIQSVLLKYREAFNVTPQEEATLSDMDKLYDVPNTQANADRTVTRLRLLGQSAPALQAHVWFNTSDSLFSEVPVQKTLADGKIRILEFGDQWCGACKDALPVMERIGKHYHDQPVEMLYVAYTRGSWGVDILSPKDEVERCRDLYVDRLKVSFPIAMWAGKKVPGEDGGMIPEKSPNSEAFKLGGTPLFVIVDGAGRIRYTRGGYDPKHTERELKTVIDFILKADHQGKKPGTPSLLQPVQTTNVSTSAVQSVQ